MKTVEQLLQLTKNPFYKLTNDEQAVLDDFLARQKEEDSKSSQNKNEKNSEKNTPVRVRNIVEKTIPQPAESGQ